MAGRRSGPAWSRFAGAVVVATVGFAVLHLWVDVRSAGRRLGFMPAIDARGIAVASVEPGGPAERGGLRAGDRLVTVGGRRVRDEATYDRAAARFAAGSPVEIAVERDGSARTLRVVPGAPIDVLDAALWILGSFFHLAIGLYALRRGPGYLNARLLFVLTAAVAVELALPGGEVGFAALDLTAPFALALVEGLQMAVELHLAAAIPEPLAVLRRHRAALPFLYAASLVVALATDLPGVPEWAEDLRLGVWVVGVAGLLLWRSRTYPEPEGRSQAALVLAGVLPWGFLTFLGFTPAWARVPTLAADVAMSVALLLYPAAILAALLRDRRTQERMLLALAEEIAACGNPGEVAHLVGRDVEASFHPSWVQVYVRRAVAEDASLAHASGAALAQPARALALGATPRSSAPVDGPVPEGWQLAAEDRLALAATAPEIVVPLATAAGQLAGALLLGPKRSEEPYTPEDRRLLQALGGHAAAALESLALRAAVSESRRIQREVLARLGDGSLGLVRQCPRCGRCYDESETHCAVDGDELWVTLPVEREIAGRYRLDRLIGKGGMGATYEASDLRLDRAVAVKVLLPEHFGKPEAHRRFAREARVCAALQHPHVVTLHDYGETATGGAWLVMELVEGSTLAAMLERSAPLSPPAAARWVGEVLEGLAAAHRAGVVHRDLKPSNILLARTPDGPAAKIVDFGLAKGVEESAREATTITAPGWVVGTPGYMAPEQLAGGEVDARTDLWAVGVILYEALTGRRAFGQGNYQVLAHAVHHAPLHLPGSGAAVQALDAVLQRLVAKSPAGRYASAEEAAAALLPALAACPAVPLVGERPTLAGGAVPTWLDPARGA